MIKSEGNNKIHIKFMWEEYYFIVSLEIFSKSKRTLEFTQYNYL